jgi:hypothetical protein
MEEIGFAGLPFNDEKEMSVIGKPIGFSMI